MEARHEHEKSRRLVRTLRPRYGTGEGLLRKSSRRLTDAIEAVGWQPRKHVGLPDEPRREWRHGAIAKMDGAPVGAGGTIIYFVCDDCAQAAKRAKEAGGHIVKDKFSIGDYGNIALVSDPDGNVVGFHSMA